MATTATPQPSTRNVTRVFRTATVEQIAAGLDWYRDAHTVAVALATANDVPVNMAAGVIAALSPLNSWGANVNLAARFLAAGGLDAGYLGTGLAKGRAILAGADIHKTLNGNKVRAFYECIMTAGATDAVCIDRHAFDVAVNVRHDDAGRPGITSKRYAATADAYRRAARILSRELNGPVSAAQVQAVTWTQWRRRYWADGAFDGHTVALGA